MTIGEIGGHRLGGVYDCPRGGFVTRATVVARPTPLGLTLIHGLVLECTGHKGKTFEMVIGEEEGVDSDFVSTTVRCLKGIKGLAYRYNEDRVRNLFIYIFIYIPYGNTLVRIEMPIKLRFVCNCNELRHTELRRVYYLSRESEKKHK